MSIQRYTTRLPYDRLLSGLRVNFGRLLESQTQISTGVRVSKPSDDPAAAARILRGQRDLADIASTRSAIESGGDLLSAASANLTDVAGLLSEARATLIQSMNGTLDDGARDVLASQFRGLKEQLMEMANTRFGDRYLYAGTSTTVAPFVQQGQDVVYVGDTLEQQIDIGGGLVAVNLPGNQIFGAFEPSGVQLVGPTGLALGTTANQGQGESTISITRSGSDLAALAALGINPVNGGNSDSFVGPRSLRIDATAGTIQLGSGPAVALPQSGSPEAQDFAVYDEQGEILHLDLSGFVIQDVLATVTGEATIAIGTSAATPIDFNAIDLQLKDPANGNIVHVNTTEISRAGQELALFGGASDIFSVLEGIAQDLENSEQSTLGELVDRLDVRLGELTRHEGNVTQAIGVLGSRSQRLEVSSERFQNLELRVGGQLGELQDADLAQAISELSQAELAVQLSQSAGSRLLNLSLLNYLR
jgi:flagellin-like hook-associated protein FlgL